LDPQIVAVADSKPLYQLNPVQIGAYLSYLQHIEPDLRARVVHLGRKNLGQPYALYLLGEFPYELHDDEPLFELAKSDCVVFAEHTYAMALADSWEEFFWLLQRIRYRDGVIGVVTRNHYTEADWNRNNGWLVSDISEELAGPHVETYKQKVDRAKFLQNRYKLERDIPVEEIEEFYIPYQHIDQALPHLRDGDFVNIVSGKPDGERWVSHVGLVAVAPDGTPRFLHSASPAVREQTFQSYIDACLARDARNEAAGRDRPRHYGFKFLRLNEAPEPPPMAPQPRPHR
jgi:hypothetical protein